MKTRKKQKCPTCGMMVLNPRTAWHKSSIVHRGIKEMRAMRKKGFSFAEIGKKFGVSGQYIWKHLKGDEA